jgi:hypothetical protein
MLPLFIAIAAAETQASTSVPRSAVTCEYDPHVLDLGFDAFDQDMKGGWRALSDRSGCENKAADIVRDYRRKYQSMMPLLYWHEAQIRASVGENREAITLMQKSYQPGFGDVTGWNQYVDATVAFLRSHKGAFLKARSRLDHLQKPKDWPQDGEWPQNGSVVEGLWKCFGKPYKIAYGIDCRPQNQSPG